MASLDCSGISLVHIGLVYRPVWCGEGWSGVSGGVPVSFPHSWMNLLRQTADRQILLMYLIWAATLTLTWLIQVQRPRSLWGAQAAAAQTVHRAALFRMCYYWGRLIGTCSKTVAESTTDSLHCSVSVRCLDLPGDSAVLPSSEQLNTGRAVCSGCSTGSRSDGSKDYLRNTCGLKPSWTLDLRAVFLIVACQNAWFRGTFCQKLCCKIAIFYH